jgi:two-component system cell cycle sensor histidine kinase/response regulator CckA
MLTGILMFISKYKIVFVAILIGLISLTVDVAREILFFRQGSLLDAFLVFVPKYKLYSRGVLLLAIIALGGFIYCYFEQIGIKEKEKGEHFQASLFASIQDGICILDNDLKILQINPALEKWFAHALPLVGKKGHEVFSGLMEPCATCPSRRTLETGEAAEEIIPKLGADGKAVGWLNLYSFPLLDRDTGKIKGVIKYIRDITAWKRAEESLLREKNFIAALFDTIAALVLVIDPQGRIVRLNQAFEATTGHTLAEVKGKYFWDYFVIPEDLEKAKARFQDPQTHRFPVTGQKYLVTKNGERRLIAWSDTTLFDEQGAVEYIISTGIDITARTKAETLLRESEERYKMLFDSAPDAILIMEAEGEEAGQIVAANPAAAQMHGYTVSEILDLNITALDPAASVAPYHGGMPRILAGEWIKEEITHVRQDGSMFPLEIHAGLMELENRRYILTFDRDISERKRREEALREAHQKQEALIQASPLAIFVMDPEGRVRLWNPAAERMFGWEEKEIQGSLFPGVPKDKVAECQALIRRVLNGESLNGVELRRRKKDGSPIDISVFTAPLCDARGRITGIVVMNSDITESKRLKEQLLQAQKMEVVGRLAGGVAHDFNNLLTAITGYSELVLNFMEADNPLRQDVAEIRKAGIRAASLTRQLLAFSRKQVLQPKVLDLNQVMDNMGKMLERLIGSDIDLAIKLDPHLGRVMADPGQIEQVLLNLAINARDAMPQGGRLTIATANVDLEESYSRRHMDVQPGPYLLLTVSDTGCGMDPETKTRIFEPFFTTKEMGKGTGLGLSTVYGIIKQSGGHIAVHSKPGKGAAFKIYLPRIDDAMEPDSLAFQSLEDYGGEETILLVEDEDGVRQLLSTVLKRQGFKVLEARHGVDALDLSAQHEGPIHLVLTDVVMPQMGGLELAQRLQPLRPGVKVLYMSGYAENAKLHQHLAGQEKYYLQKPFETMGLLQRVRQLLDAPA